MLRFLTPNVECFLETTPSPSPAPSNSFQRSIFSDVCNAPRPPPPVAQVQTPLGYTDLDKTERRISNVERMINANIENDENDE